MSGLKSRRKGILNEYKLRDEFRKLGWTADRVPSSGASQGESFKGDIKLTKEGLTLTAELKVKRDEFKRIYALFKTFNCKPILISSGTRSVLLSYLFTDLFCNSSPSYELHLRDSEIGNQFKCTLKKLFEMIKYVKSCDFLVIRIDREPFLYLKYISYD